MSRTIHDREYHARRIAANHYRQQVRPWGLKMDLHRMDDNLPRMKTLSTTPDRFTTEHEATLYAQMNANGRSWEVSYFTQLIPLGERVVPGRREWLKTYFVRFLVRVGAPFREPSGSWEHEELERENTLSGLKRWKKESSGLYGKSVKPWRHFYHRKWRHAGKKTCWLALREEDDSGVDPMPERRGILWQVI